MARLLTGYRPGASARAFLFYGVVAGIAYALFYPLLSWTVFSGDDSHLMRVAVEHGWLQHYLVSDVYLQLSAANYTPIPLTVYRLLTEISALSPQAFLLFMLACAALFTALAGMVVRRVTHCRRAGLLVMLVIVANLSMLTLLGRFYTMHYLFGGVFALAAVLSTPSRQAGPGPAVLVGLLLFLAMLSKEVYLVLPPLIIIYSGWRRQYPVAAAAICAMLVYLALRTWILGLNLDLAGESSYFAGAWTVGGGQWLDFLGWYAGTRYALLLAVAGALLLNPRRMLALLPLALLFALPPLTVTHGINAYPMHADRLFFAFDAALAITAVIALATSSRVRHLARPTVLGALLVPVLIVQYVNSLEFRQAREGSAGHRITRYIVDNAGGELAGRTLLVPLNYLQGDLMRVNDLIGGEPFRITQNCRRALAAEPSMLTAFDQDGETEPRSAVAANCRPLEQVAFEVRSPPRYHDSILEWDIRVQGDYSVGVLFIDRAFAVPRGRFSQQLVRPAPYERYQIFVTDSRRWWFSEPAPIEIDE